MVKALSSNLSMAVTSSMLVRRSPMTARKNDAPSADQAAVINVARPAPTSSGDGLNQNPSG